MQKIFLLLLLIPGICFGQDRWFSSIISVNINSFGASTNSSDNRAAIIASRDYIYSNPVAKLTLYIPKGVYQISDSIKFDKAIRILGEGTIGQPASIFVFPEGKKGLVFSFANGANGFGADVENIAVTGQLTPGYNTTNAHAFIIRTRVHFKNVGVTQFDGNGFHISACATQPSGDNNNYGNSDNSVFDNCFANYCTNGIFTEGCDGHKLIINGGDYSQNRRWGYAANGTSGDVLDGVHFAFNGVAVPGANSVVTYLTKYYVAKSGHDGYWGDATDSNYNKPPNTNPNYWYEVTATMVATEWANNVRYYSGGAAVIRSTNAYTEFVSCYTEASQPPVFLNYRSEWHGGTNGAGVVSGALWSTSSGEVYLHNAGMEVEKYLQVGTTTYDAASPFKVYNDYSTTGSRTAIKAEGTTSEVYLDLKNSTGKYARFAYVDTMLKIYTKNDSLGLTINDVGIYAKKYFGDGSGLLGLAGGGDMVAANNLSDVANVATARTNIGAASASHTHAESDITGLVSDLAAKQSTLISGTNIKTVNSQSLLGSGNIAISGAPTFINLASLFSSTSTTPAIVTGWSFAVTNGVTYRITVIADYQTAATTTGGILGISLTTATGSVRGYASGTVVNTAAATELKIPIRATSGAGSTLTTTGVTAINSPHYIGLDITFTCTNSGTFNIVWGSEVNASAAQLNANSSLIYQALN